jgi:hypothetical protein
MPEINQQPGQPFPADHKAADDPAARHQSVTRIKPHVRRTGLVDDMWTARRRDGRGGTLADPLPEGLLLAIRADYAALPVPRDLP